MANENTTTYEVIVDTQVQGQDKLEGAGDAAETAGGKFQRLQRQIRDTQIALQKAAEAGDTATFNKLKADLDELEDKLEVTQLKSKQFDDALASLPGPAGAAGAAIKGFDAQIKLFLANPIVATIGAIVGVVLSLREALSRTEEGQEKLNKISEGFTKILNGLFAILEPIANMFADLIVSLLENESVMNGLAKTAGVLSAAFSAVFAVGKQLVGFIINNFVNAFKTLTEVAGGAGKVLKGVFTFDLDLIKEGVAQVGDGIKKGFNDTVKNVKDTVKGIGEGVVDSIQTGFEVGESQFKKGQARLTEAQKKAQEERNKKAAEASKKANEEAKKAEEQRLKDAEAASKVLTEAYLSTLEQRDQEIYKRGQKLNADILALEKAGITDRKAVLEAYNKDVAAINAKFDEEQKKKDEEKKQKEREAAKAAFEEAQLANENRTAQLEQRYNKEIAIVNDKERMLLSAEGLSEEQKKKIREDAATTRLALQEGRYNELIAVIDEKEKLALSNTELTEAQKTKIVLDAEAERAGIRQTRVDDSLLGIETELENVATTYDRRRELIAQKEAELLSQEGLTENQRTAIRQQASQERQAIDIAELEARAELNNAYADIAGQFGSLLQQIAGKNKKIAIAGVIVEQASSIAKIIQNTAVANAKSVAAFPLTGGMPWVAINTISAGLSIASSIAAGIKAINQIKSADSGAAPTGAGANLPKTTGASTPAPNAPGIGGGQMGIPQIVGTQGGATPGSQIAQTLASTSGQPIRAYVVSGDITSQQALDRRTTRAATFSGGTGG